MSASLVRGAVTAVGIAALGSGLLLLMIFIARVVPFVATLVVW